MRPSRIAFLMLVIYAFCAASLTEEAAFAGDSGLVAWWSFDEQEGSVVLNRVTGKHDPVYYNLDRPDWRLGVLGNALFLTVTPRGSTPMLSWILPTGSLLEAWVAVFAYPATAAPVVNRQVERPDGRRLGYFLASIPWASGALRRPLTDCGRVPGPRSPAKRGMGSFGRYL